MTPASKILYEEGIRVNSYECDFQQAWKPAAINQRLTEAAVTHADRMGVGFEHMVAQDLYWVHSRMKTKFLKFPRAGEMVTIRTWPKTIQQKLFFIRDFEILDTGGQRLVAATSAWLVIHASSRRLVSPQTLDLEIPVLADLVGLNEPLDRIGMAQEGEERFQVVATYSDVDMLGHVNNSRYIEWICDAFSTELFNQKKLDSLQINYEHEILPGEQVVVLVNPVEQDGGLWAVEGQNLSNNSRAFEALLRWQE